MAHFYPLGRLLLVLFVVVSEFRDASPVTETVLGTEEDDVVLPCSIANVTDPKSCYRVKWIKYASDGSQVNVNLARKADGNRQMSLFLTKLQKSDEGLYKCEIWQDWDCILVKNISLKVKECKALQPVKAAPSTPVNLNCLVDVKAGQQGPQTISWEMLKGSKAASINSERVETNGTSLSIPSVNHSDSGWYRCKYLLGQTQRCFDINVIVQAAAVTPCFHCGVLVASSAKPWEEESNATMIAVVASAIIIGIAAVAALIGIFICRRRSDQAVTWQTQRHPIGALGDYETVDLSSLPSEEPTIQRVNSLYQELQDETMCTFQY